MAKRFDWGRIEEVKDTRLLFGPYMWFGAWLAITIIASLLQASPEGHGTHRGLGLPACPSVVMFDRPCPGCGMTTSWTRFVQANVPGSFQAHALGPPLYLAFMGSAVAGFVLALRKRRFVAGDTMNWLTVVLLGCFLAYGGLRFLLMTYGSPDYRGLPWERPVIGSPRPGAEPR